MAVAEEQRKTIDRTPPPWRRPSLPTGFPVGGQKDFLKSQEEFFARVSERAQREPDIAAGELLTPGGRWNNLINAIATYISGAELDRPAGAVAQECLEHGLLVTSAGERVLRLTPPLTIERADIDEALDILREVLA